MKIDMNAYDPILEEVYAIRQKISARYGHDIHKIFADADAWRKRDEAPGFKYVRLPIARTAPAPAMA